MTDQTLLDWSSYIGISGLPFYVIFYWIASRRKFSFAILRAARLVAMTMCITPLLMHCYLSEDKVLWLSLTLVIVGCLVKFRAWWYRPI
jgi:hypothetical protein